MRRVARLVARSGQLYHQAATATTLTRTPMCTAAAGRPAHNGDKQRRRRSRSSRWIEKEKEESVPAVFSLSYLISRARARTPRSPPLIPSRQQATLAKA